MNHPTFTIFGSDKLMHPIQPKVLVAYVVEMVEHERGWGQRPDGYLVFQTEAAASSFLKKEYDSRSSVNVPDCYISYEKIGYREISQDFLQYLLACKNHAYVDRLEELMSFDPSKYRSN